MSCLLQLPLFGEYPEPDSEGCMSMAQYKDLKRGVSFVLVGFMSTLTGLSSLLLAQSHVPRSWCASCLPRRQQVCYWPGSVFCSFKTYPCRVDGKRLRSTRDKDI